VPESIPAKTERLRGILERWRLPHPASEFVDVSVASVGAQRRGFVAALSVEDKPLLLALVAGCVSEDLDSQISACLTCEGDELETDPEDYEVAVNQIHVWFEHDLASASAGVAGSQSRARRRLLNRIESAIQSAPPHVRTRRSQIAARARDVATSQHGAALESELELLAHSPLPDHEWLETVAGLEAAHQARRRAARAAATLRIHALLLMRESA
jgi:hypothetical protein